ncbi:MAG: conserved repeat domain [Candidatus Sulfotelmatobacter sp.]|nr:conserved repeat domain [Candidatus Sulfotelmatobacter sp.]
MKIYNFVLCRIARFALLIVLAGMGSVASLWAQDLDQCASALPVGTALGCGALITVNQVDGSGNATAFTVTTLGNRNPYDNVEDTLVGVQNSSGGTLHSITLSSPDLTFGGIFNFDADGPCTFNAADCFPSPEGYIPSGYEGPNSTFSGFSSQVIGGITVGMPPAASGTLSFNPAISNNGSTWFAMEGTPTSFGLISQTQPVFPGVTTIYPIGADNYKITPFNNQGGELVTITAFLVAKKDFVAPTNFPNEKCVPYADFSGTQDTCVELHQTCVQGAAPSNDCDTFLYQMMTNYDLPADLPAIGGPDYLYVPNQSCPTTGTAAQSVFLSYSVNRVDPVTRGGTNPTNGCFVATYTPSAPVITGTTATFVGFNSPVSDTALNLVKAGSAVPLQWVQLDNQGNPITNLSLCTAVNSSGTCTAPIGLLTPWIFIQAFTAPGSLCKAAATEGTDALPTNAAGNSGLQNLSGTQPGLYQYNWKTPSGTPKGTCAEITFTYSSGGFFVTPAQFQFK